VRLGTSDKNATGRLSKNYLGALQRYRANNPRDPHVLTVSHFLLEYPFAFAGAVLVYVHKEFELEDVAQRYPADHYVLVDDKLRILAAIKNVWGEHVTTVFVRQGHYAHDEKAISGYRPADYTIERIADLVKLDLGALSRNV